MLLRIIGQVSFALFARPVRAQMALLDRLQRLIPPLGALHPATLLPSLRRPAVLETLAGLRALTADQLGIAVLLTEEHILARTVHILTDAAYGTTSIGVGGLTLFPDDRQAEAWTLTRKECPRIGVLQTIMELELHAAYATVRSHLSAHPGLTSIVLRVDNMAACFALVKGRTRNPRSAKIVAAYHTLPDRACARVYVAYVNTDRNPADACSRLTSFHELCIQHGPFIKLSVDHSHLLSALAPPSPSCGPFAQVSDSDTNSQLSHS